jgi:hypothetical protein
LPGWEQRAVLAKEKDKMVYYSFTNYTTPERYIRWNLIGESAVYEKAKSGFQKRIRIQTNILYQRTEPESQ